MYQNYSDGKGNKFQHAELANDLFSKKKSARKMKV